MMKEKQQDTQRHGTTRVLWGLAAASVMALGVAGCTVPIAPTTTCVGWGSAAAWNSKSPPQVTVCLGETDEPGHLEFKDARGNPVPGGGAVEAPGCVSYPYPPGAKLADWTQGDGPLGDEQPLIAAPSSAWAHPSGFLPSDGQEYTFACWPLYVDPTETALTYAVKVIAESVSDAKAKVSPLLYHGPGTTVPPGVMVGRYIEAEKLGTDLVIRSSLADRFAEFRIEINGELVADLASNVNVQPTAAGQGWITLTSIIPIASLPAQFTLSLHQRGEQDPDETVQILSF